MSIYLCFFLSFYAKFKVMRKTRATRTIRFVGIITGLLVLSFSLLAVFFPKYAVAIPADAQKSDLQRRKLNSSLICLDADDVLDTDDDITDFNDMFKNRTWAGVKDLPGSEAKIAIVDFDRDSKNGVIDCK